MMIRSKATIALLAGLVFCSMALGAVPSPERDDAIQARITDVVTAMVQDGTSQEQVEALRQAADGRREALLVQLALFLGDSESTEESMVGALLVQALEFTPEEKLTAVLPYLETEPASLRTVLAEILGTIDRPDGGTPDFAFYEQWLGQHGREPNAALIRYMYQVSPGMALAGMTRVFGDDEPAGPDPGDVASLEALIARHEGLLPWTEGERADAGAVLNRLAEAPSWWARLYAAATLRDEPELGTSALRARLAADQDPLVRSVVRD